MRRLASGAAILGMVCCAAGRSLAVEPQACHVSDLFAFDGARFDAFGSAVAATGERMLIGAPGDDHSNKMDAGAAYVYRKAGAIWQLEGKLTALDADHYDLFGTAVALDGDTALIGAPQESEAGIHAGAVYVFHFDGVHWVQVQRFTGMDTAAGDRFGVALSLSGGRVLVGASHKSCSAGLECGAAYVFAIDGTAWVQEQKLVAPDASTGDRFGAAVSLTDTTALVGAPRHDETAVDAGAAYVFVHAGGSWQWEQKLTAGDAQPGDALGAAVTVSGDHAVAGAPFHDGATGNPGAAYLFARSGGLWSAAGKLMSADGAAGDRFGGAVDMDDATLLVGAMLHDGAAPAGGAAYVYRFGGTDWIAAAKLTAPTAEDGDRLGASVALSGSFALLGAPQRDLGTDADTGSAYVFAVAGDCNDNGATDACEVLAGTAQDCDDDLVPDACYFDQCQGEPFCDDCNLNGMPDSCDIQSGATADADGDGVPDECTSFVGACANPVWSCSGNWNLNGGFPQNDIQTFSVTIDQPATALSLDLDVVIDTLRLLKGATLQLTQTGTGNLTLVQPGGLLVEGSEDGGLLSTLLIARDRTLDVSQGTVTVGPGGVIEKAPMLEATTAQLLATEVRINGGDCACPPREGGELTLLDEMQLTVTGDLVLNGADAASCTGPCAPLRGGVAPPPKVRTTDSSTTTIQGSVTMTGSSSFDVGGAAFRGYGGTGFPTMIVGGHFNNFSLDPSLFFWAPDAKLVLNGITPQRLEAAGTDRGVSESGFADNFAMGLIQVADGREVSFVNLFDNNGIPADMEALYVDTLDFRPASRIIVDGCKVYYNYLFNEAASIEFLNGGCLVQMTAAPLAAALPEGTAKNRYLTFVPTNADKELRYEVTHVPTGRTQWVLPPATPEEVQHHIARLSNDPPALRAWLEPVIHAGDCIIAPNSPYEIRTVDAFGNRSAPVAVVTVAKPLGKSWGDTVGILVQGVWTEPNGVVNVNDFLAAVQRFTGDAAAPPPSWVDVQPLCPNGLVTFADIQWLVKAFQGEPYPFPLPADCP